MDELNRAPRSIPSGVTVAGLGSGTAAGTECPAMHQSQEESGCAR
jgi:hypothetical protein